MVTREEIVAEALSWCGTPHVWQASKKGVGCDCKGLVAGVARHLDMPEGRSASALARSYDRVNPLVLKRGLMETLIRTKDPLPGDVILMVIAGKAQHLGIIVSDSEMVHTYGAGPGCVTRAFIGKSRLIDSYWTWPSLEI